MKSILKKSVPYLVALLAFLAIVVIYFSPSVLDGKVMHQGDSMKVVGMAQELNDYYNKEKTYSEWLGNMFSGMPSYQVAMPGYPTNPVSYINQWIKNLDYMGGSMVLGGLICFYILMCVMGVNRWLAIAGAIAYALASYNIIIIEAGHISKAYAIAWMPLTIAGMLLLFKNKYLWGTVLFTVGTAVSIIEGHLQITYYLAFFCVFLYLGYLYQTIKNKTFSSFGKVTALLALGSILAITPNIPNLYSNYEMGKTSIRGASELTSDASSQGAPGAQLNSNESSSGLSKDYAFQWSYGVSELFTLLVPDAYGGGSGGTLDSKSELYQQYRKNGVQTGPSIQAPTYWGDKPFTSGPVYFGAIVCFLFVLGMFVIPNKMKWWMFAGAVFFLFLSLGRNFSAFNDLMFRYLPMYNKFRTPEMALVIPGLVFPVIGFWGLKVIFKDKVEIQKIKKAFFWALGLTAGPCLVLWLMPSLFLTFQSDFDAQFTGQVPNWFYPALITDRASLASSDALRSLIFIILAAASLVGYWKTKNKTVAVTWVSIVLIVLMLADLWPVDRRYLNDSNYTTKRLDENFKESVADKEILKDKDPSYRVFNLNNPWQETFTAYYHKSVGGYHAAKLRRYQELIDYQLDPEYKELVKALQGAKTPEDMDKALASAKVLNMLNTRYIIYNSEQAPLYNPYADGNAWFVDKVEIVKNADEEMAALNTINPLVTAVVDAKFADDLKGFTPTKDSTATITLTAYKPNELTYKSNASSEQLAVFSEIYYQPGWKAYVDGKEVPHFRADWTLRAMLIPAGQHEIVYKFYPDTFRAATAVSYYGGWLITLFLLGAIVWSGWCMWNKKGSADEIM